MSGGPGNVMSRAALAAAVERGGLLSPGNATLCKTTPDSEDDVILGELVAFVRQKNGKDKDRAKAERSAVRHESPDFGGRDRITGETLVSEIVVEMARTAQLVGKT